MLTHTNADNLRRVHPDLAGPLFAQRQPTRLFRPGWGARIAARLRGDALDRELATGADLAMCEALAARAAHLTARGTRRELAAALERYVGSADEPAGRTRVQPPRPAVQLNRSQLLDLAALLRGSEPVYARGMAELRLTLRDGTGPAYTDRHGPALSARLAVARAGLRG